GFCCSHFAGLSCLPAMKGDLRYLLAEFQMRMRCRLMSKSFCISECFLCISEDLRLTEHAYCCGGEDNGTIRNCLLDRRSVSSGGELARARWQHLAPAGHQADGGDYLADITHVG